MCESCWAEEGCPTRLPENAIAALEAVCGLYSAPKGDTGGPLHPLIDDGSGALIDDTITLDNSDGYWPAETMAAAEAVVREFTPMVADERAAVVGLERLAWPSFESHYRDNEKLWSCCGNPGDAWHVHAELPSGHTPWVSLCGGCADPIGGHIIADLDDRWGEFDHSTLTAHSIVIAPDWMYEAARNARIVSREVASIPETNEYIQVVPASISFFDTPTYRPKLHKWIIEQQGKAT